MIPTLQPLLARLDQFPDQFREIKDGVQKAVLVAELDPEMALTRSRKVLELVVREVYERQINEPAGTRPLENLLQRLVKDGHLPTRLDAHANSVRLLGNVGTHGFGQRITAADVEQSLSGLLHVLEWYAQEEQPGTNGQQTTEPASVKSVVRPATRIAVVPKGLRSFDARDADFFLDLLPGARDREGLPESIRFWKHRIEDRNESGFTVGVIYGPSGCGKSSLVKAGLLPRLARHVVSVYVEATAEDTEARLLKGLRSRCPGVPAYLDLASTVTSLRHGTGLGQGQKVLVVLDQFEQWLHARRSKDNTELVQALRQCDGEHVQAVVTVRDDFWLAVSRFLNDLDIELLQGQNLSLVDLFDLPHARNVLAAFGRAFGRLDERPTSEQEAFLDQAVQGLSQEGRVICVRLALFAEMVKSKPWAPATLRAVGGTEGVGVSFLEETFTSQAASPRNRLHQKAAQAVLKVLLPETGSDIKGNMQSHEKLLEASGYAQRPRDFEELLRLLDGELRLLTPTDPATADSDGAAEAPASSEKHYQLTHDYLVPSLRDWLTGKQKETRRGRAELLLADRAAVWNARPDNRQLPSLWQWCSICWLTRKKNWTPPQRKMMRRARQHHALRGLALAALLLVLGVAGLTIRSGVVEQQKMTHAEGLVHRLLDADIAQVPGIVSEIEPYRQWTDPLLRAENTRAAANSREKLHTSLALLPVDAGQVDYLHARLLDAAPQEVPVIRDFLAAHKDSLLEKLWAVAEAPEKGKESQRLRAAAALARYDPEGERWSRVQEAVADDLVRVPAVYLAVWMDSLRPVRPKLLAPLSAVYRNPKLRDVERSLAANVLADYAADQPTDLANLLMDADDKQFAVFYPKLEACGEEGRSLLIGELSQKLPSTPPFSDEKREKLAKRQANAAVALLRLDRAKKVWPLLARSDKPDDPRVRSYLIHRLSPLGADARAIVEHFEEEQDVTIRRALLLSLGEYSDKELSPESRKALLPKLQDVYRTASDPGLHASVEWLLRTWKQEAWLKQVNDEWAKDREQRDKRLDEIKQALAKDKEKTPPRWYVNGQGQTMVVIPGPVTFLMGSPPTEDGRGNAETQHNKPIGRTFALAAKAVTVEQYRQFDKHYWLPALYTRTADLPVVGTSWFQAAAYCNWLSKQEGIDPDQWCYEIKDGEVTKLKENYLSLEGYRLPTEAEMEYATRAAALTSRYYGETEELLPKYAWYLTNSQQKPWPVGSLKPNDFGLFDVQGNVYTWCQETYKSYPEGPGERVEEDKEDSYSINRDNSRVLRGGSFVTHASVVRSSYRLNVVPANRSLDVGFRPARTFR
jgi:formylglycine-generating enzyme required for sulfatase activity